MNKKEIASISTWSLIIGIILIVFALICSIGDTTKAFWNFMNSNFLGKLVVLFSETIGTTLIIGFAFTLVSSTNSFLNLILQEIARIVIDKEFFEQLTSENRKDFLKKAIISNENEILKKYVGTERYFNQEINNCYSFFEQKFRTNYTVNANGFFESGIIKIKSEITYREYKIKNSFKSFYFGYETENQICDSFQVYDEHNQAIKENKIDVFNRNENGFEKITSVETKLVDDSTIKQIKRYSYSEEIDENDYVDIQRTAIEEGTLNNKLYLLRLLKPCENITFSLNCGSDIEIKDYATFGDYSGFRITKDDKLNKISIITKGSINPGLGITILLVKKETQKTVCPNAKQ